MSAGRRGFLRGLAAVAAASGSLAARLLGAQGPAPSLGNGKFDLTWQKRLRGEFRAVFDSPAIAESDAFWRAASWRNQVTDAYGVPMDEVHPVVVVRHVAMPLVMDDEFWTRHDLAKKHKITGATGKDPVGNPYYRAGDGEDSPLARAASIDEFLKSGGIVLGCNVAFGIMVHLERAANKELSAQEARQRTLMHLIPGVILQPSGYFGVLEAQRAGCGLFPQMASPNA